MFDICIFFGFFSVIDVNWLEIWVLVREIGVGVCVCVRASESFSVLVLS